MIVLGADTHKRSHTVAAVSVATGQLLDHKRPGRSARLFGAAGLGAQSLIVSASGRWRTAGIGTYDFSTDRPAGELLPLRTTAAA